ncbi:haloacid dehalogenase superfamily, subfamily IA, variant 1 with third motif having Dx(3-4)D or Dx(3-4)E [Desulfonauticus submarinus]|uniref:phosphoglycolate phosphatase n=1 Tax=Desulfonauticus submarinus TaxID=206665 RepID=A0A1H0AHV1_9BACT|nr:HAD-IA family hydrolase [Desulfonauticus submarinus]SDN33059.1 haloacid dehalogenase superfamily, subfamily IA, variant 1 with third motif having Dx(3-4)D or Dx(3-4)E [Desulfonauticus submarinus]
MVICNPLARLKRQVKGIIFDCDGVLFDSRLANIKYYNWAREMHNLPPLTPEEEDYVHMHSVYESFYKILPRSLWDRIEEIRKAINYKELYKYLKMEDGLLELLLFLKNKGIWVAINTNRTNTMLPILYYYNLHIYFYPVVTASMISNSKPHPESVYFILNKWKISSEEVAYIGDSKLDEECARNSNVLFWSYKNRKLKCDMYIPNFWTLKQFLVNNLK